MFGTNRGIVNQLRRLRFTAPRAVSRALAATLFPSRCCRCEFPGATPELDLCHFCLAALPWREAQPHGVVMPLVFEDPVDEMIRDLKYRGVIANARVLGELLAGGASYQAVRFGESLPRLLVPVPLHSARLRERGFNQALAIARFAGRRLEIPCARDAVRRVRDTPTQTALEPADRRRNLQGAFAVRAWSRARLLAADHVAVVDDVMTTGSTLGELRATLLAAGVARVDVWAVARAGASAREPVPP